MRGNPVVWGVLSGTNTNCAGGRTAWGSWLTCEETVEVQGKPHGFVYESPSSAESFVAATPLPQLGRFVHWITFAITGPWHDGPLG